MPRTAYDADLTDDEWKLFKEKLDEARRSQCGRKPDIARREIVNAVLYRLRTGCQWRSLPHDFPAWNTVSQTYRRWIKIGYWEKIHDALCRDAGNRGAQ